MYIDGRPTTDHSFRKFQIAISQRRVNRSWGSAYVVA